MKDIYAVVRHYLNPLTFIGEPGKINLTQQQSKPMVPFRTLSVYLLIYYTIPSCVITELVLIHSCYTCSKAGTVLQKYTILYTVHPF